MPMECTSICLDKQAPETCLSLQNNIIQVCGVGEVEIPPDRGLLRVTVTSTKSTSEEAVNSVERRFEYVLHTLRTHGAEEEKNTVTRHLIRQSPDNYIMQADVEASFRRIEDCQTAAVKLVQKLDSTVHVGKPEFYHSSPAREAARKKAFSEAVCNAQEKVSDLASVFAVKTGEPLLILEEYSEVHPCRETRQLRESSETIIPLRRSLQEETYFAKSKILVKFEIGTKTSQDFCKKVEKKN
ncbi:interleukin-1 receptor-associated kinase 1-binding protein 1 homolog [Limulus polyphemus]|uniref:Interleukin-1 receptor-associated kinase 1-binding protein 1 homolog n=1 Tax=Limulus polyphemus TaxID=6850 RepID=A0ABM1STZ2_LIMPO|nr:interleukin-1 receptor-associated kinase 1-binding protein 1 homolog [Limulus polyphemus]XP_022247098.1 interleukin-1 receptor-associated kinase 1-binding protein 1 homolog [Limulus polyphemus]XP_022247105.1 interleukin-1 receptor-associated kinase 1-binding protein 1 homolog [Limulus polyphemus]XP_022247112.1 interleukin-1 receptor-associated kinase 1-binding protein 1 homolog [Limulus polyphemus]XP_022247120.1 interleukin-1 receptor-associated kinase 1-binding protein 1 homolog [Limulus po